MSKPFKPLLAGKSPDDISTLAYPVLVSPKLDGIRCTVLDGVATSRTGKPIPNPVIQEFFSSGLYDGLDGELIVGEHDEGVFKRTTSFVMKKKAPKLGTEERADWERGCEQWSFAVFDCCSAVGGFDDRLYTAAGLVSLAKSSRVRTVIHTTVSSPDEVTEYECSALSAGYEGIMLRDPGGHYKQGRSTTKEGILLKVKRFNDAEATVIGFEERHTNGNEGHRNAVGAIERSTSKAGLVPAGDLGALRVVGANGVEFSVGSGFSAAERESLWRHRGGLIGAHVKYQYFELTESGAPRFPTFKGFRDTIDFDL